VLADARRVERDVRKSGAIFSSISGSSANTCWACAWTSGAKIFQLTVEQLKILPRQIPHRLKQSALRVRRERFGIEIAIVRFGGERKCIAAVRSPSSRALSM
jgi:hypothetical protein